MFGVKKGVLKGDGRFTIAEKRWSIEKLESLEGNATSVVIPREAMGMGDPHLLGMIGAFLGLAGRIFHNFCQFSLRHPGCRSFPSGFW